MVMPTDKRKIVIVIHLLWWDKFEKHIFPKQFELGNELQHSTLVNKTLLAQELSKMLLEAF